MADLELVGLHADGEHLVLIGPDGHRHRIAIDDALRAAVRHDRPRLEQVRTASLVRPREIQSRIRAGESPVDIARDAGVPVEQIRRYEGPVTAEREWVADQARLIPLGRESDAPRLGDLVVDRLARRGVDPAELGWTAVRRPGESWELILEFRADDRDRQARWAVDIPTRALQALDDESRWLSETDLGSADARRHLSSVQSRVYDVEVDTAAPTPAQEPAPHWASGRARRHDRPGEPPVPRRDRPADHSRAATGDIDPSGIDPSGIDPSGVEGVERDPAVAAGADEIAERIRRAKADDPAATGTPGRGSAEQPSATDSGEPARSTGSATGSATESAPTAAPVPDATEGERHEADRRTAELLEGLRASRGVRQEIGRLEEEDEDEAQWGGAPAAPSPAAPAKDRPPATVRQLRPVPAAAPEPSPEPAESPDSTKPAESAGAEAVASGTAAPAAGQRSPAPGAGRADADQRPEPRPQPGPARARARADVADPGATDDQETAILAPVLPPGDPTRKAKSRSRRTSVPSWDEIVFGSKPE